MQYRYVGSVLLRQGHERKEQVCCFLSSDSAGIHNSDRHRLHIEIDLDWYSHKCIMINGSKRIFLLTFESSE